MPMRRNPYEMGYAIVPLTGAAVRADMVLILLEVTSAGLGGLPRWRYGFIGLLISEHG
jgi:hypothetical protein